MRRRGDLSAGKEARLVAHGAHGFQQRDRIEVEDRECARLVASLHAVAGQAEDVGDAHRGGAQHVALDGDAVAVAAGDLQHRRIAHAGQKRADADGRHVAVGARRIDGVDGVDPAVERRDAVVDVLRVGGVGRVQLGSNRELAAPQHALQPPARGMAGERVERQVHARRIFVAVWDHGATRLCASPRFRLPVRRHAQPRGGLAQRIVDRLLQREDRVAALHAAAALPGLHPHAGHVRLDLAIAVGAHAAAGPVPQPLRAVHRARHAGRGEDALPHMRQSNRSPFTRRSTNFTGASARE